MAESYEREKLGLAVDALAASAAPIQKRLEHAWMAMHTLIGHGFTDPERAEEFAVINERLTSDKSDSEGGHVPVTCSRLSDDHAVEISQAIVDLNSRLQNSAVYDLQDQIDLMKRH